VENQTQMLYPLWSLDVY